MSVASSEGLKHFQKGQAISLTFLIKEQIMSLQLQGYIDLPDHIKQGGFDHAAVHRRTSRLYVAHTSNDALDVLDCANDKFLHSIPNLIGVAGALVSDERNLIFTSNRGENTVGIFSPDDEASLIKVAVGVKPNGLSRDPQRNILLAANVGDPALADSFTVSIVDVEQKKMIASVPVAGRTRWTIFDSRLDCFFVNIAEPFEIAVIEANTPIGYDVERNKVYAFLPATHRAAIYVDR
ncbi:MAG: hypothetical protein HY740_02410 [Chloroflexi bacterium]|nr:hypothetical protein [Chloroflexota bacterium]